MTTASLDIVRFRKVRALISKGSTRGEKTAARTRALAMAEAAGMSFEDACRKTDAAKVRHSTPTPPPQPQTQAEVMTSMFNKVFNSPEARAARAERETERLARCRELLREYGSEDAVFAETPREAALRRAVEPLIVKEAITGGEVETLAGWGMLSTGSNMPETVRAAVVSAWPMPDTVSGVWAEYAAADKLTEDRVAFEPNWDDWDFARARNYVLEHLLDTLPARSHADLLARLSWMDRINGQGWSRKPEEDAVVLTTLRGDIEGFAGVTIGKSDNAGKCGIEAEPVQSGQGDRVANLATPSATARRHAVLSILNSPETTSLTDREIARRVGCSPSTVGNLRRRRETKP